MNYLLDTNVISELAKPRPDPKAAAWLRKRPPQSLYLSVITLGEIEQGIARKKPSQEGQRLQEWRDEAVLQFFQGRILPVDEEVARQWGRLVEEKASRGATPPALDGLIAATAICNDLAVATRDVSHFAYSGLVVVNPWNEA